MTDSWYIRFGLKETEKTVTWSRVLGRREKLHKLWGKNVKAEPVLKLDTRGQFMLQFLNIHKALSTGYGH